jgi:hypothetical protein
MLCWAQARARARRPAAGPARAPAARPAPPRRTRSRRAPNPRRQQAARSAPSTHSACEAAGVAVRRNASIVPDGTCSRWQLYTNHACLHCARTCLLSTQDPTGAWRPANYSRRPGDGGQNTRAETASTSAARISTHALSPRPAEVLSRAAEGRTAALPSRHEHSALYEARCALLCQELETSKHTIRKLLTSVSNGQRTELEGHWSRLFLGREASPRKGLRD